MNLKQRTHLLFLLLACTSFSGAQAEDSVELLSQKLACQIQPEEYAKNDFEWQDLEKMNIQIVYKNTISLLAKVKEQNIDIGRGYELSISGFYMIPGGRWEGQRANLLITAQLSQGEGENFQVISIDRSNSNSVSSPEDLKALQEGEITTDFRLDDSNYLSDSAQGKEIAKDRVVGFELRCKLVKTEQP